MFERSRDIPRAYTHPDLDFDEADRLAAEWALDRQKDPGGQITLYAPTRNSFDSRHPEFNGLRRAGATEATWRTHRHGQGMVVAIAPDAQHLAHVDDDWATSAIVAVAQSHEDVAAWATAKNATVLGGTPIAAQTLDPVVAAAVESMGAGLNQNNVLNQTDRARIAACMHELRSHGYDLDPDGLYAAALAHGWRGDNAEGLRTIADTLNAGRTIKGMTASGIRPGLIDHWRDQANSVQ